MVSTFDLEACGWTLGLVASLDKKLYFSRVGSLWLVRVFTYLDCYNKHLTYSYIIFCHICLNRSGKSHHNFSLSSLVGVIQHAGQKRTSQGPLGNKLNAAQVDPARPSSTQSVSTQFGKIICVMHNSSQQHHKKCE